MIQNKKPELPQAKDGDHIWKRDDKYLMKGDILRVQITNPQSSMFGQYLYAICSGDGFGCNPKASGNAIYVFDEDDSVDKIIEIKKTIFNNENYNPKCVRWERCWGIDYMVSE